MGRERASAAGDLLVPGRESNFEAGRTMHYVYFTATLDAATWGAELAAGEGPGRIYLVEPTGAFEDDPNLTDKRFPGNPTRSFRSRSPCGRRRTQGLGRPPARPGCCTMRDRIAALQRAGAGGYRRRTPLTESERPGPRRPGPAPGVSGR